MKTYVGIDLGTTNSAICSFDGKEVRPWKSPEQNDVTPSAIYIGPRGNTFVGLRAYNMVPQDPDRAAVLFKRLMGTNTPISLPGLKITKSPEECSAQILKVLFGYLPEEIRNDADTGTVITVPAAFNQMQKDATMQAAELAGIGKVALMQEPVAAVMSVMRVSKSDGMFMIYDLGGGTLDVAIAESIGGRVNLLAHGGIAMCGGRDFDRILMDNVVMPWLFENYDMPDNLSINPSYKPLLRHAIRAVELAKIGLSSLNDTVISEDSLGYTVPQVRDQAGTEIYLEIPLNRATYDRLIEGKILESIDAAREVMTEAGLTAHDLSRIVFVGGPTHYKPLRDKVSFMLGIPGSNEVNPMTAVAEGAAVFAESIDWSSQRRGRKNSRGKLTSRGRVDLAFSYSTRTPDTQTRIMLQVQGKVLPGAEFQIDSLDTGWTSGRLPLTDGAVVDVLLANYGDHTFKVFVFDADGGPITLEQDKFVVTRVAASVDAIPLSHSIGIEALEKLGGRPVLEWLARAGDQLPKKGSRVFKASESLKAGSPGSINFKIYEGEIDDPITDNRFIGMLKISGSDFASGVIAAGSDLRCDFEVLDSGQIVMEISVPSIQEVFHSGHNFYSRQEGQLDYSTAGAFVVEEGEKVLFRLEEINGVVDDQKLNLAREKLKTVSSLNPGEAETERTQEAMQNVDQARKLLAQVRKEYLKEIRQLDLDRVAQFFNERVREFARQSEATAFDNLVRTAQRAIDRNDKDFENHLTDLKQKNFDILWRQDWFVVGQFKSMASSPQRFIDRKQFEELVAAGVQFMQADQIDKLRQVVAYLWQIQIGTGSEAEMLDAANIIRG